MQDLTPVMQAEADALQPKAFDFISPQVSSWI
jgi:hypothetical protein